MIILRPATDHLRPADDHLRPAADHLLPADHLRPAAHLHPAADHLRDAADHLSHTGACKRVTVLYIFEWHTAKEHR